MFKNLTVYRIGAEWRPSLAQIEAALEKATFSPCGATQPSAAGWVPPRGEPNGPLVEAVGGHWFLQLMTEQRLVPGPVVKQRVEEMAQAIEQSTGRKPGRKQLKELKDEALQELLPRAFTRRGGSRIWIAPKLGWLMLDCASQSRAEEAVTLLIKCFDGLSLSLLQTEMSPAVAMAHWLGQGEAPQGFTVDRECELKSTDEMKSVVRYARHPLDTDEVRQHIGAGKMPTRVALTWQDRVSFVLTESLQLKKLEFLDVVFEAAGSKAPKDKSEAFDADAAILTGELVELVPTLLDALGGEQDLMGSASPQPASPTPVPAPMTPHPVADHAPPWDV